MPNRQPWEINYCIRLNFARTFLKYLTVEGHERAMLQMAYRCDNLHQWARERISQVLERAEDGRGGRSLSATAQAVVQDSAAALAGAEMTE